MVLVKISLFVSFLKNRKKVFKSIIKKDKKNYQKVVKSYPKT